MSSEPPAPSPTPTPAPTPALWPWLTPHRAGLGIAVLALVYALATLRHHGVTFDSSALFHAGDRTLLSRLGHLRQPDALNLDVVNVPGFSSEFERFPDVHDPLHYPVFPGFVGAVTDAIFNRGLHLLNAIDGHHFGPGAVSRRGALPVLPVHEPLFRPCAGHHCDGVVGALSRSIGGHSFNNAKDWPCAMYYGLALLAFGLGVRDGAFRDLAAAGVLLGLAFAAKFNAVFAVVTAGAWGVFAYLVLYWKRKPLTVSLVGGVLAGPYLAFATFFFLWPWLYYGGPREWWGHLNEYVSFMVAYGVSPRPTWSTHALACVVFMSPPLVLVGALAYLLEGWRGGREAFARWALVGLWWELPILRSSVPHSNYYDANRHFIEYIPGLCAGAGAGLVFLGEKLWNAFGEGRLQWTVERRKRVLALGLCAATMGLLWPVLQYMPFETVYFNRLIGGLGGAQKRALFSERPPHDHRANGTEGDYWFSSVRDGLRGRDEACESQMDRDLWCSGHADACQLAVATEACVDPSRRSPRGGVRRSEGVLLRSFAHSTDGSPATHFAARRARWGLGVRSHGPRGWTESPCVDGRGTLHGSRFSSQSQHPFALVG